jgi:single-strand DNA-binding protein
MRGVNKVILIGNATRNAELRHTGTGKAVSNIRLATNRVVSGQESTQFHTVICWDKLAEITSQYVKKGEPLYVEGRLEYRTFEDGDGVERGTVEIVARDVQFLGQRRSQGVADTPEGLTAPADDVSPDDVSF